MASTPTTEPAAITAGDSFTWQKTLADYPAGTWTLKYRFINAAGKIDITAAASGSDHAVTVAAATTAAYASGDYTWQAYVTSGAVRHTVASGRVTVKPNLAAQLAGFEARSTARKALDDTRAALATWISSNGQVQEYQIAGRVMKYSSIADIQGRIQLLEREVAREEAAEKLAAGLQPPRRVLVRF